MFSHLQHFTTSKAIPEKKKVYFKKQNKKNKKKLWPPGKKKIITIKKNNRSRICHSYRAVVKKIMIIAG